MYAPETSINPCSVDYIVWYHKHLYNNHVTDEIVFEQLSRTPKALPTLKIKRRPDNIFEYELDDFEFEGYEPHPRIVAPIAI